MKTQKASKYFHSENERNLKLTKKSSNFGFSDEREVGFFH